MRVLCLCLCFLLFFSPKMLWSQQDDLVAKRPEKVHVVPGQQYEAGWLHRLFLGDHWRDLWTISIEADVLGLEHFAGGLTPIKRGKGRETKSLTFRGRDGKEYKFRSIDKDPKKVLPADLQESIAADLLQDQISSANPLAAMIAAPLLNAVGVLNAEPQIVVLPDDERLGEYRQEYGGLLGTLEESPNEGPDGEPGFAGADKVVGTYTLFRRMEENHNEQVEATEFLKARLMDIYLGDWDRHRDQWRWAGFEHDGNWVWKPIPRDRDQAFSRMDGLIPWIATQMVTDLNGFGESYPDIESLTWTGRYLDRRLLVSIDKRTWDSVTTFIVSKLVDSVIEHAVQRLPPEMYASEGPALERALRLRRSKLREASEEFYELCTKFPDIRGTDKADYTEIQHLGDQKIRVVMYKRDKESGGKKGEPLYERIFSDQFTKELRVYLLGGDDQALVEGDARDKITVRVIGGEGEDDLVDKSNGETVFYDSGRKTKFTTSQTTKIDQNREKIPASEFEKYEPSVRDYGHLWRLSLWYGATPDDGLFLGGGPILYDYAFRADPYNYRMELRGGLATIPRKFRIDYTGEFYSFLRGARFFLHLRASQLEVLNFFGFGNETPFFANLRSDGYYKVHQQQFILQLSLDFNITREVKLMGGGGLKYISTDLREETILHQTKPYGSDRNLGLANLMGGIRLDTRDNFSGATRGVLLDIQGSYFPKFVDNEEAFGKVAAEARTYLSANAPTAATLALRIGGEKIWGRYPFFESSFLGGVNTLRGFERQRFAGDASVYGNVELRFCLGKFSFLVPEQYGLSLFSEAGRVFFNDEESNLWHSAVGGGIWFSFIRSEYVLSISIAHSNEKTGVYVTGGFAF